MNKLQYNLKLHEVNSDRDYTEFFRVKPDCGINAIDLFCGCGGFSLGFKREGFEIVAGVDNDFDSLQSFRKNLRSNALNFDLSGQNWINIFQKKIQRKSIKRSLEKM